MLDSDKLIRERGFELIAGLDEAGRGPLAGPVVAASVILQPSSPIIDGLDDSKKLSLKVREQLFKEIKRHSLAIGVGIISEKMIDASDILKASHLAMSQALDRLKIKPELVLIDGPFKINSSLPQIALVAGDALSPSIAAASIVAKVVRDRIMDFYDKKYPQYGFRYNRGYPTLAHKSSIHKYGPCPIHRRSFRPIKEISQKSGLF
ncbi:MAG: ribonuclease HII [Candidatus Tectomicrobia bacterium]|uniref:Ribonuclease HII n=1 Tax=Tectimicrobiota bacterium TaxID=2528274 RepID=A0A933GMI6_UNCTE|nr:ribonuclease HII [Candidatus Tectomicrobia bacterium]